MTRLAWDQVGTRKFETGVDHGVLHIPDNNGSYETGVAWSGLTGVTESPSGAEPSAQYADNMKYLNLFSAEEFGCTIEAFTYPDEFDEFNGLGTPTAGVTVSQQTRKVFGFSYRTRIGNDVDGDELGYKIHLVYGCQASPSEQAHATVNDSPAAMTLSWTISTTPVSVAGMKPASKLTIDSTKVNADDLAALEQILYGATGVPAMLPTPNTVIAMFAEGVEVATPTVPPFDAEDNEVTIPTVTGVDYKVDGVIVTPATVITLGVGESIIVVASPKAGYVFPEDIDNDWQYVYVP